MTETEIRYLDAAKSGDAPTVKAMLDAGVEIDTRDDRGTPKNRTALMHAAANGHLEAVELLLNVGAKLEATDKGAGFDWPGRNTPLILAIKNKHIKVANRLLDAGANPKAKSVDTTALRSGVEIGEFGLVKRLVELGADPAQAPTDRISAMLEAIYDNNAQAVELFLENGADPNARTPGRSYLISGAVHKGNLRICQLLHSHGASLNVRDDDYRFTPLMEACIWSQDEKLFRFLLSAGAAVNEVNVRNETAMDLIEQTYQRHLNASPQDIQRMAKKGEDVKVTVKSLEKIKAILREAGARYSKELAVEQAQVRVKKIPRNARSNVPDHEGDDE